MFGHAFVGPLISAGVDGGAFTMFNVRTALAPQPFVAATLTVPPKKPDWNVTEMAVSFTPGPLMLVAIAADGTDHEYPVAANTLLIV